MRIKRSGGSAFNVGNATYPLVPGKPDTGHVSKLREVSLHLFFIEAVRDAAEEEDTTLASLRHRVSKIER